MMKIAYKRLIDLGLAVKETIHGSRKGIEDTAVSLLPQIALLFANFVIAILIARGLGPDGMGKYALILSVSGLATALSDLGIGQTAIRFAARAAAIGDTEQQHSVLRWAFRCRLLLTIFIISIVYLLSPTIANKLWHDSSLIILLRMSLLTCIFAAISAIPVIYFQSIKRFKMNAAISIGQAMFLLVTVLFIAIADKWSLKMLVALNIIATAMGSLFFLAFIPKSALFSKNDAGGLFTANSKLVRMPGKRTEDWLSSDDLGISSFAFYMLLSSVFVALIMRMDLWLMGIYLPKDQIGIYAVASRLFIPLAMALTALNTALWPRSSSLSDVKSAFRLLRSIFRLSLIAAAGGVIYSLIAPLFMPCFFGADYESGILVAQILCMRYCFAILLCPLGVIGYSFGFVKSYWWVNLIQLIAVFSINIVLLPRVGIIGAAIALVINEIIGMIIIGSMLRSKIVSLRGATEW
ncbi:MAG: oligosaccharide flippase family protein [bacterium]